MKKIILLSVSLFCLNISFSQEIGRIGSGSSATGYGENLGVINLMNTEKDVKGSVYLFDEWDTSANIQLKDKKQYIVNDININLKTNTFEAKLSKDSIFIFNLENVRRLIINNKSYVNYNYKNKDKIFQSVYYKDKVEILKGYSIKFVEGSSNPMVNRPSDEYIKNVSYFYKKGNIIHPVKLKTKSLAKELAIDKAKAKELIRTIKENSI